MTQQGVAESGSTTSTEEGSTVCIYIQKIYTKVFIAGGWLTFLLSQFCFKKLINQIFILSTAYKQHYINIIIIDTLTQLLPFIHIYCIVKKQLLNQI